MLFFFFFSFNPLKNFHKSLDGRRPTSISASNKLLVKDKSSKNLLFFFFVMVPAMCLLFIFNITCTKRSSKVFYISLLKEKKIKERKKQFLQSYSVSFCLMETFYSIKFTCTLNNPKAPLNAQIID